VGIGAHQFLRNERAEWEQFRREVTPYERQRYMVAL
jgi:glutamine synthetase